MAYIFVDGVSNPVYSNVSNPAPSTPYTVICHSENAPLSPLSLSTAPNFEEFYDGVHVEDEQFEELLSAPDSIASEHFDQNNIVQ